MWDFNKDQAIGGIFFMINVFCYNLLNFLLWLSPDFEL